MEKTRLSSKGQIVIPKSVRDAHGWAEGTEFTVEDAGDRVVLRPERRSRYPKTTIDQVAGCLPYDGRPKTLDDMKRGMDEALQERWDRKSK